jgi:hypothetical protein
MRRSIFFAIAVVTLLPATAPALFHFAHISEVGLGVADAPAGAQYVEIEMEALLQENVTNSILSAWDCDGDFLGELLVVPNDVALAGAGVRWIMATATPLGGMTPDFGTATAGMPGVCGQVCWGAPGLTVPDPGSWDHTIPNNYVDCVAYGGYTGTTRTGSGTPTPLTPENANQSLTRVSSTNDNATDFALACATPENNAGIVGDVVLEPCLGASTTSTIGGSTTTTTVVSTSTTVGGGSTTSTTLQGGGTDLLPGKLLKLKTKAGRPEKSSLLVVSQKSASLTLGRGADSADDPTENGGRLLVSSSPGGGFVDVYPLDATGWDASLGKGGTVTGYRFRGEGGAVTSVKLKEAKTIKVKGKGATLGHDLDDDPAPVDVVLEIGEHRYCMQFGGTSKLKPEKSYTAKKAAAPAACAALPD